MGGVEWRCRPSTVAQRGSACRCAKKAAPMAPVAPTTSAWYPSGRDRIDDEALSLEINGMCHLSVACHSGSLMLAALRQAMFTQCANASDARHFASHPDTDDRPVRLCVSRPLKYRS